MALPKGTKLELYLLFWQSINNQDKSMDQLIKYNLDQYIFKRVAKNKPRFSMNDALREYNTEIHRRFNLLSKTDQTTVMIMDKMPEDAQFRIKE